MRKKFLAMLFSVMVITGGGMMLGAPAYADHSCDEEAGCTFCMDGHSGDWDNCCYACGGASCTAVETCD